MRAESSNINPESSRGSQLIRSESYCPTRTPLLLLSSSLETKSPNGQGRVLHQMLCTALTLLRRMLGQMLCPSPRLFLCNLMLQLSFLFVGNSSGRTRALLGGSSERARAPREHRRGQSSTISGTLAVASVPGPTSVRTRPWHVGAPGLSRPPHA